MIKYHGIVIEVLQGFIYTFNCIRTMSDLCWITLSWSFRGEDNILDQVYENLLCHNYYLKYFICLYLYIYIKEELKPNPSPTDHVIVSQLSSTGMALTDIICQAIRYKTCNCVRVLSYYRYFCVLL